MMATVRGNGMRKTFLQHLSDQEMDMKVDNRRSTIHVHSRMLQIARTRNIEFLGYQWIGARGRLWGPSLTVLEMSEQPEALSSPPDVRWSAERTRSEMSRVI